MTLPRAVLFDLGGTVLRQVSFRAEAWSEALPALLGRPLPCGPSEAGCLIRELITEFRRPGELGAVEVRMEACLRHLHERLGVNLPWPEVEMEWRFWEATSRMAPEPGIHALLESLRARSIAVGMVSNSMFRGEVLRRELARHGLADFFPLLLSSADYALRKPHPSMFRTACARLGFPPEAVCFVGDSFANDVAGAAAVGMHPVWYNRLRDRPPANRADVPHREIHGWEEFLDLVRSGSPS